ncbi:hypothetical protein R6Q59_006937 [Mikania micrantha]
MVVAVGFYGCRILWRRRVEAAANLRDGEEAATHNHAAQPLPSLLQFARRVGNVQPPTSRHLHTSIRLSPLIHELQASPPLLLNSFIVHAPIQSSSDSVVVQFRHLIQLTSHSSSSGIVVVIVTFVVVVRF